MDDPPVLWHIELDDELADTKIIAEAWDAGGLYQVGYFPGYRWAEWNGRYRDDIRRFVKGDQGIVGSGRVAHRRQRRPLPGRRRAADQQHQLHHRPRRLHAQRPGLVQRQAQRGQRRGQPRRHERQPELELRRRGRHGRSGRSRRCARRQVRNFLTILMLSQGVPMMIMGDEARQTQFGNNNAYCQDNEITWFDWDRAEQHAGPGPLHQRAHRLPQASTRTLRRSRFFTGERQRARPAPTSRWHGCQLYRAGLERPGVARPRLHARRLRRSTAGGRRERRRHPRHDEHGLGRPRLRGPDGAGPALVSGHRHGGAVAGRHRREGPRAASFEGETLTACAEPQRRGADLQAVNLGAGARVLRRTDEEEPSVAIKHGRSAGEGQGRRRRSAMAFSFADTIAGYVSRTTGTPTRSRSRRATAASSRSR